MPRLLPPLVCLVLCWAPAGVHSAAGAGAGAGPAGFASRLTAGVADVDVEFGLVVNHANTISAAAALAPPPGNYARGTMVLGMLRSLETAGAYEVYVTNSTGSIPLLRDDAAAGTAAARGRYQYGGDPGMCLYKWVTTDFQKYQGGACVLWLPSDGLGDIKTITRDDASGTYYMLYWGPKQPDANGGTPYLFTSTDHGDSWQGPQLTTGLDHYNPPGTTIHAKDDLNLIYQPGVGLVDLQMFWQKNVTTPGGEYGTYCDSDPCNRRRVLGTMFSPDGMSWKFTGSTRIPGADVDDPPELQFYRSRPFFVPGTRGTRVFAHTLLYVPSPWINDAYGIRHGPEDHGDACKDPPNQHVCHGPHMYEEWWTLRQGASGLDASPQSWRRPARFTKMAPENAYLFAQPGLVGHGDALEMVWVGSGTVYTLPLHRAVGLWAPANARVRVPAFDLSTATAATRLWINADAHWGPKLPQGGCDETCAAYVLAELEDADGHVIDGYNRSQFNPIMDQDGINLPLRWNNSTQLPAGHGNVTVKIWFRAAKVYAVYLGEAFDPGY